MEFGVFNGVFVPGFLEDPDAEHKRIMHESRIVLRADELGFKYHWAAEHHFLTEYSHLSDNPRGWAISPGRRRTSTWGPASSTYPHRSTRRHASPSGWRCSTI